jgi:hypothetical protein
MSRRFPVVLGSLLVLLALAVPALASAAGREFGTENAKGVFKAFAEGKKEKVTLENASRTFTFELEAGGAGWQCKGVESEKFTNTNTGGIGHGEGTLIFFGCEGTGELSGCIPNQATTPGEWLGSVTSEVNAAGTGQTVTVREGFELKCFGLDLGPIYGKSEGAQPAKGNVLTFTDASGWKWLGQNLRITGAWEAFKGAKGVVIN